MIQRVRRRSANGGMGDLRVSHSDRVEQARIIQDTVETAKLTPLEQNHQRYRRAGTLQQVECAECGDIYHTTKTDIHRNGRFMGLRLLCRVCRQKQEDEVSSRVARIESVTWQEIFVGLDLQGII